MGMNRTTEKVALVLALAGIVIVLFAHNTALVMGGTFLTMVGMALIIFREHHS